MRYLRRALVPGMVVATALAVSACSTPTGTPNDAFTARVMINNQEMPTTYTVDCTQLSWLWTVETLPKTPGFTAIVQTGAAVEPKVFRIHNLAGFTGSSWNAVSDARAAVDGTTFHVSGTAHGSFDNRPTKPADVHFRMEAHC